MGVKQFENLGFHGMMINSWEMLRVEIPFFLYIQLGFNNLGAIYQP